MGACDVTVIIVDFEASSLLPGTFPIEVAWVFEDGSGEAHLIRPVAEWLDPARDNPGWSAQSEKIHGISLESLLKSGEPADVVARRAAAVLADQTVVVCSDAPPMDELWLQRLFEAGGIRKRVSVVDVERLYGWRAVLCSDCCPHWTIPAAVPLSSVSATSLGKSQIAPRKRNAFGLACGTGRYLMPSASGGPGNRS